MSRARVFSAAAGLAGVLALALAASTAAAEPTAGVAHAGFVRYEMNKWLFRPCIGTGRASKLQAVGLPFIDAAPGREPTAAIQQLATQSTDPQRGVYLEFAGTMDSGRIAATELQRALGWVESCAARPSNIGASVRVWAAGHEPGWSLTLDGDGVIWRTPDRAITFPAVRLRQAGDTVAFESEAAAARIRIELTRGLCLDTMAEAAFGRRVVAAIGGRLFEGCGLLR
jgi:uncharacterized membrane protein